MYQKGMHSPDAALMQQPGAIVLLDIAKAFDTIDPLFSCGYHSPLWR
jgi:hypothetical protein